MKQVQYINQLQHQPIPVNVIDAANFNGFNMICVDGGKYPIDVS